MPKVVGTENLYFKTCPRCHEEVDYEKVPGKGWRPLDDATFEVGDYDVNLVCPNCGWRIGTSIQPKNVWQTIELDEEDQEEEKKE